jgi:hypothetical protein
VAGACAHRWREVFVERRDELLRSTRFIVFGHASHDALGAPFVGLCGKALFIEVDAAWLELPAPAALAGSMRGWRRHFAAATSRRATGSRCRCSASPAPRRRTSSRLLRRRAPVPPAA